VSTHLERGAMVPLLRSRRLNLHSVASSESSTATEPGVIGATEQ